MAEIISLSRARKAKARADKAAVADANRAKFGRTKAEKQREAAEAYRLTALLDGAKLDD
ncbi:DUF4169 family protein [Sphingomonas sp. RS2018]